jgi:hypothetical protein
MLLRASRGLPAQTQSAPDAQYLPTPTYFAVRDCIDIRFQP